MTFKDLQEANKTIQMMDIKGKQYAQVPERIRVFRMLYPEGFIKTDLISVEDGICIMKGTAGFYADDGAERILAEAYAYEREDSSYINKTSFIENCCTSVTGRVLGKIGIGSDTSVASYEEVTNAIAQQEADKKISTIHAKALANLLAEEGIPAEYVCGGYKVKNLSDLTEGQHTQIAQNIKKIRKAYEGKA